MTRPPEALEEAETGSYGGRKASDSATVSPKRAIPDGGVDRDQAQRQARALERQARALEAQADALERVVKYQRIQTGALVELIRTLDEPAPDQDPTASRSGKSVAKSIEDGVLHVTESIDLRAVDSVAEDP